MKTYYTILQVNENACMEVVEAAWKALMRRCHPDQNPNIDPRIPQEINAAHDVLSNPEKRRAYNQALELERNRPRQEIVFYRLADQLPERHRQ
jgi:curved DNA-binding protein CbpA